MVLSFLVCITIVYVYHYSYNVTIVCLSECLPDGMGGQWKRFDLEKSYGIPLATELE